MITLHDYELSAECYKARLLLAMLGLEYRLVPVDIHPGEDHRQPAFLDLNPLGEVPVLVDGPMVMTDVPAILVWLAGRYDAGRRWLPEPADALAGVAQWLGVSTRLAASAGVARMALAKTEDVVLDSLQSQAHRLLRVIDEHLWFAERRGEDWLLPQAHPTIADVACFPDLALSEEAGISHLDYPAIRRWIDRVRRIGGFTVMSGIFPASPGQGAFHRPGATHRTDRPVNASVNATARPEDPGMAYDLPALLRKLPKVELHLHLEGSIGAATAADLSRKHGIALPDRPDLYAFADLVDFLSVYSAVAAAVREADDFRRVTYEMLTNCAANGARYVEFFFSPHVHLQQGVRYDTQIAGIRAGMRDAETDFRVVSRIVPGISRELGPAAGFEMLDLIVKDRPDELIGIGLDFNEAPFPPEPYRDLFAAARRAGLHVTSHAGETGPAAHVRGSLDALGSERIDHGYAVVDDIDLMQRCKDEAVVFTVCPSTSEITSPWHDLSAPDHAIRRMIDFGLKVCINSDDPPMFRTDLGLEYEKAAMKLGLSLDEIVVTIRAGIGAAWLDDSVKRSWSAEWDAEISSILEDRP